MPHVGIRASVTLASRSLGFFFSNFSRFAKIAAGWALVVVLIALVIIAVAALSHEPFDLAAAYVRLQMDSGGKAYDAITNLASLPGQMAVAIWATRLILRNEMPEGFLTMPTGAARYFGYSFVLGFALLAIVLAIGLPVAGALTSPVCHSSLSSVGQLSIGCAEIVWWGTILAVTAAAFYLVVRFWLKFPAIALGEDLTLGQSFRFARGSSFGILLGTIITLAPFLVVALIVVIGPATIVYESSRDVLFLLVGLGMEGLVTFVIFCGIMTSACFLGLVYREIVPDTDAQNGDLSGQS